MFNFKLIIKNARITTFLFNIKKARFPFLKAAP